MKKRIWSFILAFALLLAMIPTFVIGAYATDGDNAENESELTYEDYKNLWYDDGHLVAFLDLCKLTEDDVARAGSEYEEKLSTARLVLPGNRVSYGFGNGDNEAEIGFVKIIGGQSAGRYYPIAASHGLDIWTEGVNQGFINYHTVRDGYNESTQEVVQGSRITAIYPTIAYTSGQLAVAKKAPEYYAKNPEINGENVKVESYYRSKSDVLLDGTYGTFTIDETMTVGGKYYWSQPDNRQWNHNICGYLGGHGGAQGAWFVTYNVNSKRITGFSASWVFNVGMLSPNIIIEIDDDKGKTVQFTETVNYVDTRTITADVSAVTTKYGLLHTSNGRKYMCDIYTDGYSGGGPGSSFDQYRMRIDQGAYNAYYLRIYDGVTLNDEQILRNHFADLCYYYQLKNTDKLEKLGAYALNMDFYRQFEKYSVGEVSETNVATLQSIIDAQVSKSIKIDEVKALLDATYAEISNAKNDSQTAIDGLTSVLNIINTSISDAGKMNKVNEEAEKIVNESVKKLTEMKNAADLSIAETENIHTAVNNAYTAATTAYNKAIEAYNALMAATGDKDYNELMLEFNKVGAELSRAVENAKEVVFSAEKALAIAKSAKEVADYVASANANASTNPEDYIKFAGYQARITDYPGMRAVFTVDTNKLAKGFTYLAGTSAEAHYNVVAVGMIYAYSADDINDIAVTYRNGVCSSAAGGSRIQMIMTYDAVTGKHIVDPRYRADASTSEEASDVTLMSGDAYAIETSFVLSNFLTYKEDFQRTYSYRAFIVLEGENTTYVRYVNATMEGSTKVSLYNICAKIAASTENYSALDPHYYITKVLYYVNGDDDT